jgi:rhodanese-related sulfurtransferase
MIINKEYRKVEVEKISPKELDKILSSKKVFLLDVRPNDTTRDPAFIVGARLIPLVELANRYNEIPSDTPVIITDWAMRQSVFAAKFLKLLGYDVVGILKGGIERWRSEKFHVEIRHYDQKTD